MSVNVTESNATVTPAFYTACSVYKLENLCHKQTRPTSAVKSVVNLSWLSSYINDDRRNTDVWLPLIYCACAVCALKFSECFLQGYLNTN